MVEQVSQISQIVDLISRVGFPIVCAALFIIIFIINYNREGKKDDKREEEICNKDDRIDNLVKTMQEQYEKTIEIMQEQNKHTIDLIQKQNDTLVKQVVHGVSTRTISDEDSKRLSEVDEEISEYLVRVQNKTNSDRVAVMLYHNGGNDSLGNPFPRMSMRYEQPRPGIPRIMDNMKNMFKSYLHELCSLMDKQQEYVEIENIESIKDSYPSLYQFLYNRGVNAIFSIPLRNNRGITVGFIFVEFSDINNINKESVKSCLHDKQLKIEALLNINRK